MMPAAHSAARQVPVGRLQILADGEHVHIVRAQIAHHLQNFIVGFAESEHQPRFCFHQRFWTPAFAGETYLAVIPAEAGI